MNTGRGISIAVVDGVRYARELETDGCDRCAGQFDPVLCHALPSGCSKGIVWVRDTEHETLGRSTPAGLYKPTHGGYPGV